MFEWGFHKYGRIGEDWPVTETGEKVKPAFLEHLSETNLEAEMDVNLLTAYGIPVVCTYPNNGDFGRVMLGMSGTGVDVYVPETMLEDARNIMGGDIVEEEEV